MFTRLTLTLIAGCILAVASVALCSAQEFYYDLDTTYAVVPSSLKIAVQFDTTRPVPTEGEFLASHSCLNAAVEVKYLHRGFRLFGLQATCGYSVSVAELISDAAVHRVVPVYSTPSDMAEFKVSDLVDVQFEPDLSRDSALALLESHGLRYVDSSEYVHNLWRCALDDTVKGSPLAYGNTMHVQPGVTWACARQYASPDPAGMTVPTDPYYEHQYYLKNTGQSGGTPGNDISAELAWQVPLTDSSLLVAVIDDGVVSHPDLSAARVKPGYDFAGNCLTCRPPLPPDNVPTPGMHQNHGMACAGILAASHNGIGIAGVFGSCRILPVKIFDNGENSHNLAYGADTVAVGDAIYYAAREGARVISNSWVYQYRTTPIVYVANAIRYAVNSQSVGLEKGPQGRLGAVVVFAAGNDAAAGYPVEFPANMPEVIAVGAINKSGAHWAYSCGGSALDVVAPSGDINLRGDQWTVDQMQYLGWNPNVTGAGDANGDQNYTSKMGGTSGACPQVAGIAALLLARGHADISPYQPYIKIREIITQTATDMGPAGWDEEYGYGRANAYKAMQSIIRGDVNNDGFYDVLDVVKEVDIAFSGDVPALGAQTGDLNCDGFADVFDVIYLVNYAFGTGPAPVICYQEW